MLLVGCSSPEQPDIARAPTTDGCPPGTQLDGDVCRPRVVIDCPAGTTFREGVGCVAATVVEPPASANPTAAATTAAPAGTQPRPPAVGPTPSADVPEPGPCGCRHDDTVCIMRCGPRPPPLATASRSGAFDRATAANALLGASRAAQVCRRIPGPTGPGTVVVVFEPNGTVSSAKVGEPYKGTPVGDCVERLFLQATVPAFQGEPVTVSRTFHIE